MHESAKRISQCKGRFLFRRVDADQQNIVAGHLDGLVVGERDRLPGPQVLAFLRAMQAEFGQIQVERMRCKAAVVGRVEDGYSQAAAS
jgi:hypothetical protein